MKNKKSLPLVLATCLTLLLSVLIPAPVHAADPGDATKTLVFEGKDGPGKGKHVVFLTGDEEYRSEEGLPMLAKILSQRHGFKCTVLFALDPDGTINPQNLHSLPGAEALDSADAIVMLLRFRDWPDDTAKHFFDAYERGVPIIGLRTATHAFAFKQGSYKDRNNFGKKVLGEQWVSHWGRHKQEATRGIIEPSAKDDPVLRGVSDVFGTTDVYEAYPPADAKILIRGEVLKGMNPTDPAADYSKKRSTDKQEQGINNPMMPVAWTRINKNDAGKENKILCTTMGAATDLQNEGLRRMIVNAVYWGLGMEVPQKADVTYVDPYHPSMYGFGGNRKGLKPADMALGKALPEPATAEKNKSASNASTAKRGAARTVANASSKKTAAKAGKNPKAQAAAPAAAPAAPTAPVDVSKINLASEGGPLKLNKDDHIAILGNTLADRMQHAGYFETLIYSRFPELNLVVRNLSAAADEVGTWHRSENFGSRDEWLAKAKANVIFAFYGFDESFKGQEGLAQFKQDLDKFLKDTVKQNYSGHGAPRVVLFSPIANEKLPDPNYPDPAGNNANIKLYAGAMAEVAKANNVQFVDLFTPSQELYAQAAQRHRPLTINTLHLTDEGYKLLAPIVYRDVFGETAPEAPADKLREAVNAKSWEWHTRYRTVDGYNVYGGRSKMAYESPKGGPKITNFQIMQQEMTQRDVLTANLDKRVWAVAQGKDLPAQELTQNVPPVEQIKSNFPGPKPDGSWPYKTGEEAIKDMKVPPHCKVTLFASEEQFPELINPVQMAWDTKGRLWVSAWRNYPERTPESKVGDSLLIFEDTNGDGKADKCIHFADDLNCPTGFQFYKDGVLLMQAPDLWFLRDTTGGDHANYRERVLMGMDSADSHHTTNSMVLEPGGATFLSDGVFHRTQVETATGPVRNADACIYRFEPRTGRFERYAPYGFANPHGRVFDYWGNDYITDATGNNTYFGPAISGHLDGFAKHKGAKQFWERPSRPCPGTNILTSRAFPEEFQNNFLDCNVISFQGIYRVKMHDEGGGTWGETIPQELISSSDFNFRPTAVNVAPDGSIYILDWSNAIIGHLQHHLRDPNRDHQHGRIYRMTYEGLPLLKPAKIDGQPIPALLELLKVPENDVRTRAKIELGKHDAAEVVSAVKQWIGTLDPKDPTYAHNMTEALWVHQWMNVVDVDLLKTMLRFPSEPRARAAATRVLCYWRDRVPGALDLLKVQATDEDPRVRLQAVRAASFFPDAKAADVALASLKYQPLDYYLDYVLNETMRQLEPYWQTALKSGQPIAADNPAGTNFLLKNMKSGDLLKLPHSSGVLLAILTRPDVSDADRNAVIETVSNEKKTTRSGVVLSVLDALGTNDPTAAAQIARLLPMQPQSDLQPVRDRLMTAATSAGALPDVRQPAWAAIATADGSFAKVWQQGMEKPATLTDVLLAIPLVYSPDTRAQPYANVKALLVPQLPSNIPGGAAHADEIRRAAIRAAVSIGEHQPETFAALTSLVEQNIDANAAARGIRALPRTAWDKAQVGPLAEALVKWAKTVPASDRTSQEYLEATQLATDLAGQLPPEQSAALRKDLKALRVDVAVVRTVREQMRYDTPRIVVEAGKPFEIIFENGDFMPHNLTIVNPGTREEVGTKSATMRPDELDKEGRAYMPKDKNILAATKLLEPGQKQTLKLTAPRKEGDYEYVCTYPGHWQVMWGRMIVTKDVDAYLQSHPDAGPAGMGGNHQAHAH